MKKYFKTFLFLGSMSSAIAEVPNTSSIVCSDQDSMTFSAQSSEGQWQGGLSASGMWTMQMHMVGGNPMTSSQRYLYFFTRKHAGDGEWGWRFQSRTGNVATYLTSDAKVTLKLTLQRQ